MVIIQVLSGPCSSLGYRFVLGCLYTGVGGMLMFGLVSTTVRWFPRPRRWWAYSAVWIGFGLHALSTMVVVPDHCLMSV